MGTLAAQGALRSRPVGRFIGYLIVTTVLGALADTIWQIAVETNPPPGPTPTGLWLRAMPIVIVALGIVNFLLGASLLQLRRRQGCPWLHHGASDRPLVYRLVLNRGEIFQ